MDGMEGTPPTAAPAHSQFGQLDIQDFNLIEPISRGSFGRVYLAEKKTTKDTYAIKVRRLFEKNDYAGTQLSAWQERRPPRPPTPSWRGVPDAKPPSPMWSKMLSGMYMQIPA